MRWVRAGDSAIHGGGVYARVALPRGTRVIEYTGERITKAQSRRREHWRAARQDRGVVTCVYIFVVSRRHDIDARRSRSVARLINHSCAPNCASNVIAGHIWIIAQRDIAAGEELSFDYGYPYSEWRLHPCRCGAPRCPGFMVETAQRWRLRRQVGQVSDRTRSIPAPVAGPRVRSKT